MKPSRIILTKGLPASGKSTWAFEQVDASKGKIKRINKDDLRAMLDHGSHSKHKEEFVLNVRNEIILTCVGKGMDVIVDDTNLAPKHEEDIKALVKDIPDVTVSIQDFTDVPLKECLKRNENRANPVPEKVIIGMHRRHIVNKNSLVPVYVEQDSSLPSCVICDLDGTLALLEHRSPYDYAKCVTDEVNQPILDILLNYKVLNHKIVLLTGRDGGFEKETREWLKTHRIPFDALIMRPFGDKRKDSLVKDELYTSYIKDKYKVAFVLDDRDQVVDLWRQLGLPCLQVFYGAF